MLPTLLWMYLVKVRICPNQHTGEDNCMSSSCVAKNILGFATSRYSSRNLFKFKIQFEKIEQIYKNFYLFIASSYWLPNLGSLQLTTQKPIGYIHWSHLNTVVQQRWAWTVLGWETAKELLMQLAWVLIKMLLRGECFVLNRATHWCTVLNQEPNRYWFRCRCCLESNCLCQIQASWL